MPSPFPGMDPYLEGDLWSDFHHELCIAVKHQLTPKLRPGYYPFTSKYFVTDLPEEVAISTENLYPDVGISKGRRGSASGARSSSATAPVTMRVAMPVRVPHLRIEIRDIKKRRLVTVIEFLSPTNKKNPGRKQYLRKRRRILDSSVHLVEMDLLRQGKRPPMREPYRSADYFVLVGPEVEVWPIQLEEALPIEIPIPLLSRDGDVQINLQQAVEAVYELGGYDSIIDYNQPPDVALSPGQEAWADQLLRSKALRS